MEQFEYMLCEDFDQQDGWNDRDCAEQGRREDLRLWGCCPLGAVLRIDFFAALRAKIRIEPFDKVGALWAYTRIGLADAPVGNAGGEEEDQACRDHADDLIADRRTPHIDHAVANAGDFAETVPGLFNASPVLHPQTKDSAAQEKPRDCADKEDNHPLRTVCLT